MQSNLYGAAERQLSPTKLSLDKALCRLHEKADHLITPKYYMW